MNRATAQPIPWVFTDMPGILMWTWVSDHFVARIAGAEITADAANAASEGEVAPVAATAGASTRFVRSYNWDVADRIRTHDGLPRMLIEGTTTTFEQAENLVREHVGKLYDPALGYRAYCGALANTFTLTDGSAVDVTSMIGTQCAVTVLNPDGSTRTLTGKLSVSGYRWHLTSVDTIMKILPEHAIEITNTTQVAERARSFARTDNYTGMGRIYSENPGLGCTGHPGYSPGTVDHAGEPTCPIHEEGRTARLVS